MARTKGGVSSREEGQALTEYAVMFVVVLLIIVGTIRMMGQRANASLSRVVDAFQQHPGGGGGDN